ncbi:glycosyltransferase [Fulvivirga lutea]|uniref:Glycosyltransferase n=1 Tax=Fulvivirga lutea TaxID=2810512 RepID=A0A974WJP8_9BACT|nr:glycosyltransferase [Fulvivirga lutea]QSE98402.1 glycosyltransferase [Fulvivirga lutea]
MTFWILTTEYPPLSGGGISTYCYHTGQMLLQEGHEVTVFIPDFTIKTKTIEVNAGVKLVKFRPDDSHFEYLGDESAQSLSFSEIIEEHAKEVGAPDFMEAQEYNGIAYFALQKKLLLSDYFQDTLFYITAHAPGFLYLDYNQAPLYEIPDYWTGEMEKSVLKSADLVISPSQYLIDKTDEYYDWSKQERTVIFNPYKQSDKPELDFTPFDIVFFGKLTPQKGCIELLSYFKRLWDQGFEHPLRLIGGGNHFFYPKMMDLSDHLRKTYKPYIDKRLLIFEGHINPEHINSRLKRAHIILVPSIIDNLPYTVLEAMSLGKIVLASDCGGHKELINTGENGFIFSHDKKGESFISNLKKILSLSKEAIASIGQNAIDTIESNCSYSTVYKRKFNYLLEKRSKSVNKIQFPFTETIELNTNQLKDYEGEKGKLTVVIPFFNMGNFINEAIDSVINSTYANKEILIIDDGSTDDHSIEVLKSIEQSGYAAVFRKENEGLSATRNYGATIAKGEFIAFLDADDKVTETYYEKAIGLIEKYNNISFVGCWASYFEKSDISWPSFNPEPPYLLVHNMINSSALIYRKKDFMAAGKNDSNMIYGMEDYESVINMVKNGFRGVAIPEKLWEYRIRKGSMAQSFNNYSKNYLYRLITKKHSGFYSRYASEIVNILNANGSGYLIENPTRVTRKPFPFANTKLMSLIKGNKFLRNIAKSIYRHIKR